MVLFTGHEMTQHSKLGYSSTEAPFKRCNFKDKLRVVLTMVTKLSLFLNSLHARPRWLGPILPVEESRMCSGACQSPIFTSRP